MSMVAVPGAGLWMPPFPGYQNRLPILSSAADVLLDADEEEAQIFGTIKIDGGGTKTFGTTSQIGWLVGATTITFAAGATLRVGVKKASSISTTLGPPARATLGAAAFDVYDDLVGGTDTLTTGTWYDTTMTAGTPFTVASGDLLAVCFHLNVASGSPVLRIRGQGSAPNPFLFPIMVLVTSGPTHAVTTGSSNVILTFNDGTLGWFEPSKVFSVTDTATATIGVNNSIANIFQVPFPCEIDALAAGINPTTSAADFALEVLSTPLGTPAVLATVPCDATILAPTGVFGTVVKVLPAPVTLEANTPYALAIKQTTAASVTSFQAEVATASHLRALGLDETCYAANSTAGAAFVAQQSGRRRYIIFARISALDDGTGGAALLTAPPPRTRAWRQWRRTRVG